MNDRIEKTIELKSPVSRVWRALTDHREFGAWFRVTVDFHDLGGQRTRTVQRMVFDTVEECERVKTYGVEGNRQTNARLKAYLETLR